MRSTSQMDLYQHISLHVSTLKFFSIWFYIPHPKWSIKFWLSVFARAIVGILVYVVSTGGQLLYVVKLVMSGNAEIQEVAGIINLVLTEMLSSFMLLDLRLHRDKVSQLIDQMVSEKNYYYVPAHDEILRKAVRLSRWLFVWLLSSCSFDVTVHAVVVPALHRFQTLPLKMDLIFFDINAEPYFNYICAYQILYKPMMVATCATVQSFSWAVMIHAISQLDILIYNFENMKDLVKAVKTERNCDDNEAFRIIFKQCVIHHRDITRFVAIVQSTFGRQMSYTLMLITGILCTTSVQILSIESPLKNISVVIWVLMYLCIFILILFIDCYFGNTITAKSLHVATVAFACPWLNLSKDLKKSLLIFIARTQQPLVIIAAKLVPVSMETFTKVMNWTYKVFAVMNQMKK